MDRALNELLFPSLGDARTERLALRFVSSPGASPVELSYEALLQQAAAHAATLRAQGLEPGARVAVWTHPSLRTLVALVANAHFGFVTVPLNPALGARELEHVLADAAPQIVVADDPVACAPLSPRLRTIGVSQAAPRLALPPARSVDDAPLLVLYTSGTTGAPKGAVLTSRNVAANLDALAEAWAWTPSDTIVHALPLFHVHGLVLGLYGALRRACALEWHAKFDPLAIALALDAPLRVLFSVPTMIHRLAEAAPRDERIVKGLKAARLLISGSAGLPVREHERIEALTGRRVIERYGLTETLINCSVRVDDPSSPGRVGKPLDGVQLRLVDDARAPLDVHDDETLGEIAVRGPHVFAGYLNRDDATRAVLDADGWFYTGDLATRDARGSLRIVGRRATDLIKTAGYKVGAGEIEAALLEHAQVRECAVLGEPDADLGERIVAFVVAREPSSPPTEPELVEHVGALIAKHKRPRVVRFVDELPRNAMGKVVKSILRQLPK